MFPEVFLWGASTSAHPDEGGDFDSDWWHWEQRPGRIADGATSKTAANHRLRFTKDYDLARKLGHTAHLVACSWARIMPAPDRVDETELAHYVERIDALRSRSIEPLCALFHVAVPQWFARSGGWHGRNAPDHFARYVRSIVEAVGAHCRFWLPMWEPVPFWDNAYLEARWPPCRQGGWASLRTIRNLFRAHDLAYSLIHGNIPDAQVGLSLAAKTVEPLDEENPWHLRTARHEEQRHLETPCALLSGQDTSLFNRWLGAPLKDEVDFMALTDCGRQTAQFAIRRLRQLGTQFTGEACHDVEALWKRLRKAHCFGKPMLLLGSGLVPPDDETRCRHILDHRTVVESAIEAQMPILGYIHQTFLDGFEWTQGYSIRRGLVHVDRETLTRTPNASAYLLKDIIESGAIRSGAISRFGSGWKRPKLEPLS